MTGAGVRFPFVRFEFVQALGPAPGRYVVGDPRAPAAAEDSGPDPFASADVLMIDVADAGSGRRLGLRGRGPRKLGADDALPVTTTVATVIRGTRPLTSRADADALMAGLAGEDAREQWVAQALGLVNRAIRAYRLCAADPYVVEMTRVDPRRVAVGYGTGSEVFHGQWEEAVVVPPPPSERSSRETELMAQHGVATMLSGAAEPELECEELLLRAALDREQGRLRSAALGLQAGGRLLVAELGARSRGPLAERRLEEVGVACAEIERLAERALAGTLSDADDGEVEGLLRRVGAAIDAWRYEPDVACREKVSS